MNRRAIWSIAVLAFVLRLLAVAYSPKELSGDEVEYTAIGKHLRFNRCFSMGGIRLWGYPPSDPADGRLVPSAFRAPGLLVVFATLWGADPATPPTRRVQLFNALCGTATAAITTVIAGNTLAGVIVAVWPLMIQSDADPLSEALFDVLMITGVFLWQRGSAKLGGVTLGLAALTRVTLAPCFVLFAVASIWLPSKLRYQTLIVSLLGAFTVVPWTIRNAVVFHKFIPVAIAGSGSNLLLGTIVVPPFSGASLYGELGKDPEFYRLSHSKLTDEEAEHQMQLAGINRLITQPIHRVYARLVQYPRFLLDIGEHWYRPGRIWAIKIATLSLSVTLIMFGIIGLYTIRNEMACYLPPALLLIALLIMHAPIMAQPRLGAPLIPLWAIFASLAIVRCKWYLNLFPKASSIARSDSCGDAT